MPASALRKVKLAKQPGFTTAVSTATVQLMAVTDVSLQVVDEELQAEVLGNLAPIVVPAQVAQHVEGSLTAQLTYQDLAYYCHGVFGTVGSSAAASTTYVWKYAAGVNAVNTPFIYTMQYGGPSSEYSVTGTIMKSLEITGEAGGVWEGTVELLGRAYTTKAMTSSPGIRTVQPIRMADTKFYVNAWASSTIGTTEVPATLISFTLTANPNHHLKTFAGDVAPRAYGMDRWEGTLTTVLEFNSSAKAFVDGLKSGVVQRQLAIKASMGSGSGARSANILFAGTLIDGVELFGDRDGNMTVELTWQGTYHSTLGTFLKVQVQNENSALT